MPNKFLKDSSEKLYKVIKEVFSSGEGTELRGELVHFDYTDKDCSDLTELNNNLTKPRNEGPGIRIAVKFNNQETRFFYYPENTCNDIDKFLDNLNTDFGMTQIMEGKATRCLGITYHNIDENLICFTIGYNQEIERKLLDKCWNPHDLTFNVKEFFTIKKDAEKEVGIPRQKGLFNTPNLGDSINVLGIKKENFLKETNHSEAVSLKNKMM